jgi:arylformamidase
MTIHDISIILGEQDVTYPGDPAFVRESPGPAVAEAMKITMCAHSGTHLDSPAHFVSGGRRLDDYQPADFILPAHVIEIFDPEAVTLEDLEGLAITPSEAILFRTGNSHSGRAVSGEFSERYVYVSAEAAQWCVDRRLALVGLDYTSIDRYGDDASPAHHILLGNGVLVLEGLNLAEVRPGQYTLICLPLRIEDAEGAPARAVLLEGAL